MEDALTPPQVAAEGEGYWEPDFYDFSRLWWYDMGQEKPLMASPLASSSHFMAAFLESASHGITHGNFLSCYDIFLGVYLSITLDICCLWHHP
jgi:hypothetical protein